MKKDIPSIVYFQTLYRFVVLGIFVRRSMNRAAAIGTMAILTIGFTVIGAPVLACAQVETVFIVPGAHFDVGFNDLPSVVREHRIQAVEDALEAIEKDPSFHWMEDGAWGFSAWLKRYQGDSARMEMARRALQSGQLTVSAVWVSPHGSMFHESLDLLTVHLDEMERLLNHRPQVAVLNDPPSHPEALVDALVSHGVRYILVGANMFVSSPLPAKLVRSPFWWETSKGVRALVYIDTNGYWQAASWPGATDVKRFSDITPSTHYQELLSISDSGFRNLIAETTSCYDALVFEDAGDDSPVAAVKDFPELVRLWNAAKMKPRLVLSSPLAYFRHIEAKYGEKLPVFRGEWGGQWGNIRANCPVWTWRLREAMKLVRSDSSIEVREALSTAMDHGLTLGPGYEGMFTEQQTVAHAREQAQLFAIAVESAERAAGKQPGNMSLVDALPTLSLPSEERPLGPQWQDILSDPDGIRVRAGRLLIAPFIPNDAPLWETPLSVKTFGSFLIARTIIDRHTIPGADSRNTQVTLELPLQIRADRIWISAEDSSSAIDKKWLCDAPPAFVIAPEGIRLMGLPYDMRVTSPLAFSYTLVPDPVHENITWLQVLLVRQCTKCILKGKIAKVLPFNDLFPGEPEALDTWVKVEVWQP